ncbi:MAG: histidine phosphatase family protein [Bacilli bacterium]|nr:histidine phosphatase family protein [Bacilli bacterium]
MTTTIYIVRHGQTDGNKLRVFQGRIDTPLNDTGREQILETCKKLAKMEVTFDILISSPLSRALESAQIIRSFYPSRKPIIIDDNVIERSFGMAEGIPLTDENYKKIMNNEFIDQESEFEILKRAKHFIYNLLEKYPGKTIMVVTHSHFLKACMKPYIKSLQFNTKTLNAGVSILKFNDFKRCLHAAIDINKE